MGQKISIDRAIQTENLRALRPYLMRQSFCVVNSEVAASRGLLTATSVLLQNIADQNVREECFVKVARAAARHGKLTVVEYAVQTVSSDKRNECCMKAAESAVITGNLEILDFIFKSLEDRSVLDEFCAKTAIIASWKAQWTVVIFLIEKISDQTERDRCCLKAVKSATRIREWSEREWSEVKSIAGKISDLNQKDACYAELAKCAVSQSDSRDVEFLVDCISNADVKDDTCMECGKSAARSELWELLKFLMQKIGNTEKKDMCCTEAAKYSAQSDQLPIVQLLVETISKDKIRDQCCVDSAKFALKKCHWKVLDFLVHKIADPDMKLLTLTDAAKHAATMGEVQEVKDLSADQMPDFCRECTIAACSQMLENVVAYFGIEPDWLLEYSPVLRFADLMATKGNNRVLYATLSQMRPEQIPHLLRLSISQDYVALALTLIYDEICRPETIDLPDNNGATALMLAADSGHHDLINQLLDLGASLHAEDNQGRTALSRACEAGHARFAKILLDRGADVNHRDSRGETCVEVAERLGASQILRLFGQKKTDGVRTVAFTIKTDDPMLDRQLSEKLHECLKKAGFTKDRAECQQRMADWLEAVARALTQEDRRMTGSYAEGWANSLEQVNGKTGADSDIDWTVLQPGKKFHIESENESFEVCEDCKSAIHLRVEEGHALVTVGSGSQPAVKVKACGVRPEEDTCYAIKCCSKFFEKMTSLLFEETDDYVHLVRATRPNKVNELRLSFTLHEREVMRSLSTVQAQLFTIIKFIFKRYLPLYLNTPGLKTYHAKTLLLSMMEKHKNNEAIWHAENLIALLKESVSMMFEFMNSSSSPDECMPHIFVSDAQLYFKNAGIGGDFDNTKTRVRNRLSELQSNIHELAYEIMEQVRPLNSDRFYFHPFTLLPLMVPPTVFEIKYSYSEGAEKADAYSVVYQCLSELQLKLSNSDTLMEQLGLLGEQPWCRCAAACLTAMAHLKFNKYDEAKELLMKLTTHETEVGLKKEDIQWVDNGKAKQVEMPSDLDWAWRFCFPCDTQPHFPFLPEFTQTLLSARLSQPRSSHLYVNFRCLSWSLQAELLDKQIAFGNWKKQLEEDTDFEELLTLAHYSVYREHIEFSLEQMKAIRSKKKFSTERQEDEDKIRMVQKKLESEKFLDLSSPAVDSDFAYSSNNGLDLSDVRPPIRKEKFGSLSARSADSSLNHTSMEHLDPNESETTLSYKPGDRKNKRKRRWFTRK